MLTAKCIGCGCTDDHACVENGQPCHWLRVNRVEGIGVCSSCPDALNQFASTSQEQATGQDDYRNSPEWKDFSSRIGTHRHQFWALGHTELLSDYPKDSLSQLTALAAYIAPLLDAPRAQELSPSLEQWTLFYQRLAQDLGLTKSKHIRHDLVAERVRQTFSDEALEKLDLKLAEKQGHVLAEKYIP